jgi:hypothetical protein
MARSLPVTALAASFGCSASDVSTTIEPILKDTKPPWDTVDIVQMPDTVPYGIPCRVGYHAVWDTVPCGIPCRVGYRAVWDTVPRVQRS